VRAGAVEDVLAYPHSGPREAMAVCLDTGLDVEGADHRGDLEDRAKALSLHSRRSRLAGRSASPEGP
jgi:hypothetical protein